MQQGSSSSISIFGSVSSVSQYVQRIIIHMYKPPDVYRVISCHICKVNVKPSCTWKVRVWVLTRESHFCAVRDQHANSHAKKGWEPFTDAAIRAVSQQHTGIIFLLWGNSAQEKSRSEYFSQESLPFWSVFWSFIKIAQWGLFIIILDLSVSKECFLLA
jgi:hypothetical protein